VGVNGVRVRDKVPRRERKAKHAASEKEEGGGPKSNCSIFALCDWHFKLWRAEKPGDGSERDRTPGSQDPLFLCDADHQAILTCQLPPHQELQEQYAPPLPQNTSR
jgi:hypothetical protein